MRALRLLHLALRGTIVLLPFQLKRLMSHSLYGYQLDPTAQFGLAWMYFRRLRLAACSRTHSLSLFNMANTEQWGLTTGQPARWMKLIKSTGAYFSRRRGFVD